MANTTRAFENGWVPGARTFSGTHDFDPTVLVDTDADEQGTADDIIWNIGNGRCPRCEGPLPTAPEFPAGSRITACRSIPICGRCGADETFEAFDAVTGNGFGISGASCWPLPVEEIEERRARHHRQMKPAIITGDGHLVTEDGSTPVINPCNTGGWAQYGDGERLTDERTVDP
jgi:hypothetical protein